MKKVLISLILLCTVVAYGQSDCKVLRQDIAESYSGACKKGLAHGKGEAKGEHTYVGNFKKGLPDGQGTMTYENGAEYVGNWKKGLRSGKGSYSIKIQDKDSIAKGLWKDDMYIGKSKDAGYKVVYQEGVQRYTIKKVGDATSKVSIEIFDDGNRIDIPIDIKVSTGNYLFLNRKHTYESITIPFSCDIKFTMPNRYNSWTHNVEFKFKIEEPGEYEVQIHHKNL